MCERCGPGSGLPGTRRRHALAHGALSENRARLASCDPPPRPSRRRRKGCVVFPQAASSVAGAARRRSLQRAWRGLRGALRVAPVLTAPERAARTPVRALREPHRREAWRRTGERERARTSAGHACPERLHGLHLSGRRPRGACDAPAAGDRVLRLMESDPQTGVAPGWTRGRKVRSKCR